MKTYTFDFDLDAWISGVEIDADSYEEALEKLRKMKFEDIVSEGYCNRFDINDIDYEVEDDDDDYDDENDEEDD